MNKLKFNKIIIKIALLFASGIHSEGETPKTEPTRNDIAYERHVSRMNSARNSSKHNGQSSRPLRQGTADWHAQAKPFIITQTPNPDSDCRIYQVEERARDALHNLKEDRRIIVVGSCFVVTDPELDLKALFPASQIRQI